MEVTIEEAEGVNIDNDRLATADEFYKDVQILIYQVLDGPTQSFDDDVRSLAERIETKLSHLQARSVRDQGRNHAVSVPPEES